MKLEFFRVKNSKASYILFVIFVACFILGWILPVGLDKVNNLVYREYLFSTYTVFTQFGFLMFSFLFSYIITKDYSEKTILFYKLMGDTSLTYFLKKASVLIIESAILLVIFLGIVSFIYQDWSAFLQMFYLMFSVLVQYIVIVIGISIYAKTAILSIGSCLALWITSIIFVGIGGPLSNIAFFDASNNFYLVVKGYLESDHSFLLFQYNIQVFMFIFVVFFVSAISSYISQKAWLKNGIE